MALKPLDLILWCILDFFQGIDDRRQGPDDFN